MALTLGARLGVYEVTAQIGEGGMGQVYRATDTKLKRQVAIKVLPPSLAADRERLARFQREAEVLAALNHPNIAAIYGLEESEGITALVMELVEGDDLSQHIAKGAIPLDEALPIAKQIAEAVEAAHEQGIIHRDLKPANIKVRADGTVKVLDFGLAKALEPTGAASSSASISPTLSLHATMAGVILGTAAYMSPEQAKGRTVDKRSDVWAFGAVLYEMFTGRRAFEGDDVSDTLAAVLRGVPDWDALPADTPTAIRKLLRRCLEKDRKRRLADIADVRLEIDEALTAPSAAEVAAAPPATVPRPLLRRAIPVAITAIVAAAATAVVAWALWPVPPPAPLVTRSMFTLPDGQNFTNAGRQLVAISPDGARMVYVANTRLYLRSMSELEARPVPGTESSQGEFVSSPVFSPDGQSIAFWSGPALGGAGGPGTLKRIAVTGGVPVPICQVFTLYGISWVGDAIVFGQGSGGIMRVPATGGKPELLVAVNDGERAHGPQLLPGGEAVLFTLATGTAEDSWDKARILVQQLKSGDRKPILEGGSDARYLPTGHLVYALSGVVFAVPFDLRRLEVTGGPVPILEGVRRMGPAGNAGAAHFSVSNAGSLVYIPGPVSTTSSASQRDLALFDREGGVEPLKLPPGPYEVPRVSPDGTRVAFGTTEGKEAIISIYDLSGTSAARRLTVGGNNRFPTWSSDSQRVAFQSDREGDLGIFWQRADGTGTAERLTKPDQGTSHVPESWSPVGGDRFLFRVTKDQNVTLWTFSLKDKKREPFGGVQSAEPTHAVFSPDGSWVAYHIRSNDTGRSALWVQPFPATGAKYQVATESPGHLVWSPEGKELFYALPGTLVSRSVTTQPSFTVGNPVRIPVGPFLNSSPANPRTFDMARSGKILGIITAGSGQTPAGTPAAPQIYVVLNWFEELKRRVPTK